MSRAVYAQVVWQSLVLLNVTVVTVGRFFVELPDILYVEYLFVSTADSLVNPILMTLMSRDIQKAVLAMFARCCGRTHADPSQSPAALDPDDADAGRQSGMAPQTRLTSMVRVPKPAAGPPIIISSD